MTPLPDHQMTSEHETSTPAEDHQSTSTTKITEPITPLHHDPMVIFVGAGAPPQEINDRPGASPRPVIVAGAGVPGPMIVRVLTESVACRGGVSC